MAPEESPQSNEENNMVKEHVHDENCDHDHAPVDAGNPLANLSPEIQQKIQELQMMEQTFQQLMQQKHAFSMEKNETDYVIKEVEKVEGEEVSRIVGGQVIIKTTKESVLEEMNNKKKLIDTRMESIEKQEKEFSENMEKTREEVMNAIQG